MALRIGVSEQTLSHFERTGKSNLLTFVRILEVLNASQELQAVLQAPTNSIEAMRAKAAQPVRQRAYNGRRGGKADSEISSEASSKSGSKVSPKIITSDSAKRAIKTRKTP